MKGYTNTTRDLKTETAAFDPTQRKWLEAQGYEGYRDEELARFGRWTRFAPAICAAIGIVGTALASATVIWVLTGVALLGATLPLHPFDLIYNRFLRERLGTGKLPHHGLPRRFACTVATVWLLTTGWMFYAGHDLAGYILGSLFVVTAGIPAVIGFCVPSFIYRQVEMVLQNLRRKPLPNK